MFIDWGFFLLREVGFISGKKRDYTSEEEVGKNEGEKEGVGMVDLG